MTKKKGGLGKGLGAIFVENETEDRNEIVVLKISQIEPNRKQPRRSFDEDSLAELAQSIEKHGVLQPILVRPTLYGTYQIVAGERRFRASRMAGLIEIPAIIREMTDSETAQLALIENLQREDLTALEEAAGYASLIDEYGFSQEEVAKTVGKSRPAVSNALRLLNLPDEVKPLLEEGKLSPGHARALLAIEDKSKTEDAAKKIIDGSLSVRETENLVKKLNSEDNKPETKKTIQRMPVLFKEIELSLNEHLGTKVKLITGKKPGQGTLCIDFYSPEELLKLAGKLSRESGGSEESDDQ